MSTRIIFRRSRRAAAFTLAEVAISMAVFLMMTMLFAACFPIISGQAQASDNNAQAAQLAQHKIDQLRSAGFSIVASPASGSVTLANLGIIDASSVTASTAVPYTAAFTSTDNIAATTGPSSGYYPAGATGTFTIQDLATVNSSLNIPAGTVYEVTVTIQWPSGAAVGGKYSVSALIAKNGEK